MKNDNAPAPAQLWVVFCGFKEKLIVGRAAAEELQKLLGHGWTSGFLRNLSAGELAKYQAKGRRHLSAAKSARRVKARNPFIYLTRKA